MQITSLTAEEFEARYQRGFVPPDRISRAELEAEWEDLRDRYRAALSRHWSEDCFGDADFAISDDWHCSFYHCGGTTSPSAESFRFLDIIRKEIQKSKHASEWLFHLTVGVDSDREGEVLIDSAGFYANGSRGFDYSKIQK